MTPTDWLDLATWSRLLPALGDHLWQSTLVVGVAAMVARAVGGSHASVRHAIWLAASMKFLVPFSVLWAVGTWTAPFVLPALSVPIVPAGLQAAVVPFFVTVNGSDGVASDGAWMRAIAVVWIAGAAALSMVRIAQWTVIAARARVAKPLTTGRESASLSRVVQRGPFRRRVVLRESSAVREPSLFGFVRPVILWPPQLTDRLDDETVDAIVTHEVCHAERRDNLAAAGQILVEIVFWFHPVVWWIGARLVDERERACDRAVLRSGTDPRVYAEGLLEVCRFGLRSYPSGRFVSAVTSSDLSKRVEAIMSYRVRSLGVISKSVMVVAGTLLVSVPIAAGVAASERIQVDVAPAEAPVLPNTVSISPPAVPAESVPAMPPPARAPRARPSQIDPIAEFRRGALAPDTPRLKQPIVLRTRSPNYTPEAMRRKVAGSIELEIVVSPEGTVDRVRVVRGLDSEHGLDEQALAAIREWEFTPGSLDGKAVAVWCQVTLSFNLH